jgi:transcriptional regulator with XRE-family HTH domain
MKYSDYKKQLEQNPEYREAQAELQLAFDLGDAVLQARLKKGWTQTELARQVGTRQANISRIEAGLANPTLELIRKICKALDLNPKFQELETEQSKQEIKVVHVAPIKLITVSKPFLVPEWEIKPGYGNPIAPITTSTKKEVVL